MAILTQATVLSNLETLRVLTKDYPAAIRSQIGNSSGFVVLKAGDLRALNLKIWRLHTKFSTLREDGSFDFAGAQLSMSGTTIAGQSVRVPKETPGSFNFRLGGFMKIHSEPKDGCARNIIDGHTLVKLSEIEKLALWVDLSAAPDDARVIFQLELEPEAEFKVPAPGGGWATNPDGSYQKVTRPAINIKNLWLHNLEFSGHAMAAEVNDGIYSMEPEVANLL
jgi:hypothetical protein